MTTDPKVLETAKRIVANADWQQQQGAFVTDALTDDTKNIQAVARALLAAEEENTYLERRHLSLIDARDEARAGQRQAEANLAEISALRHLDTMRCERGHAVIQYRSPNGELCPACATMAELAALRQEMAQQRRDWAEDRSRYEDLLHGVREAVEVQESKGFREAALVFRLRMPFLNEKTAPHMAGA